jgi:predicted DsbA family dithiol-disulfide isomerase
MCWAAERVLGRLRADDGVEAGRRPFELHPAPFPLPAVYGDEAADAAWSAAIDAAGRVGIEVARPPVAVRTRKAHEAAMFAAANGCFDGMHEAIFRAYLADGRDIGRIDVLVDIGVAVGLDRTALKVALDIDAHTDEIDTVRAEALRIGVTTAPTFAVNHTGDVAAGAPGDLRLLEGFADRETLRRFAAL